MGSFRTWAQIQDVLWSKTTIDPITGCWLWRGTTAAGYGVICWQGSSIYIHRLSFQQFKKQTARVVRHDCDTPICWNPDHLLGGTHKDNTDDMWKRGRNIMPTSTSRLSYQDCYDIFNAALANERGIRFEVPDFGAGNQLRVRLHYARSIDRKENREAYATDHKLYGRSIYDPLVVRLRNEDRKWWIIIEKFSIDSLNIQPLGKENVLDQSTDGHLREVSGEGHQEPREEASEAAIDIFDGEAEQEAQPEAIIEKESPAPIQTRRRL